MLISKRRIKKYQMSLNLGFKGQKSQDKQSIKTNNMNKNRVKL